MDQRMALIYQLDGQPKREDGTFAEFMAPDEAGRPRLCALIERVIAQEGSFFLTLTREIYPHDYTVGSGIGHMGKHL